MNNKIYRVSSYKSKLSVNGLSLENVVEPNKLLGITKG